jgi:hypothetical protein
MELSIQAAQIAVLRYYLMRVLELHLWITKKHRKSQNPYDASKNSKENPDHIA